MSDEPIKCPGCDVMLPDADSWAQALHMQKHHPEIIRERLGVIGEEANVNEVNLTDDMIAVVRTVSEEMARRLEGELSDKDMLAVVTALSKAVGRSTELTANRLASALNVRIAFEVEEDLWAEAYGGLTP